MRDHGQNVGPLDRATRIILGTLLLIGRYFFQISGIVGEGMVLLGGLWIWEGFLGYCLLYGVLGWSTRRGAPGRR